MKIATKLSKLLTVTGGLIVVIGASRNAHASTMFFTDVNAFDALTNTTLVEDFEAFAPKNRALPSFVSNGNTYTGLAGVPHPNVWVTTPGYANSGVPATTSSILTANGEEDFTVEFGTPTEAVGFDTYVNAFGPATVSVFGTTGLLDTFLLNHDPATVGFLGILASEEISSIRWSTVNGRRVGTGIDNIVQGTEIESASTPEPTSVLSLIGLGVLGFGSRLLKRTSR
ncbi:MAG: PEP-CTERM sorting domain-containing protein [Okeania sp. SIO3I5]|uniref:PEP-CTERM sorting domain-containing protein n=1 Tax=Okeania sp. SIO3I5 TaxID=2607805 RepID=UPI0013BD263C|nr:PEP-CTERM sorting domain-containing protein [Okeania sp. SIO3I5]NEQ40964.1 PEP-CTERM sorting domain-containing protein [Okeania sp. SIO3I5]